MSDIAPVKTYLEPQLRQQVEAFAEQERRSLSNALNRIVAMWAAEQAQRQEQPPAAA